MKVTVNTQGEDEPTRNKTERDTAGNPYGFEWVWNGDD